MSRPHGRGAARAGRTDRRTPEADVGRRLADEDRVTSGLPGPGLVAGVPVRDGAEVDRQHDPPARSRLQGDLGEPAQLLDRLVEWVAPWRADVELCGVGTGAGARVG